ncbi:hypothetical protein J0910_07605 [Nocardiopsis sp. CNT-189]|uniref:hypothetical protein n=1 Tax=Nocardiopsis oceanisediminis TaxID=2816862 RepID=UPI003B2B4048
MNAVPPHHRTDGAERPPGPHRPLLGFALLSAVLAAVCCVGLAVDGRMVAGEPVWLKPLKFAVSFGLYAAALAWMFGRFPRWRRTLWWLGTAITAALLVETAAITFQAARGRRSHFNFATGLDEAVQNAMGAASVVLVLFTLAIGVLLVWQRRVDRPMAWAIRAAVLLSVAGMAFGPMMTQPTPDQLQALEGGADLAVMGAHTVGAPDGGAGMPLTWWSTTGGDLRIPHFAGLHALQVLPLFALGITLLAARVPVLRGEGARLGLVAVAAAGYTGLIVLLAWQAFRGQPLLQPDAATLAAAGALALGTVLGAAAVLAASARRLRSGAPERRARVG